MNVALIFAGGSGTRMHTQGVPKQFLEINGVPIIIRTIELFENHDEIDAICVVCIKDWIPKLKKLIARYDFDKVACVIPGGEDGQESIRNGLSAIKSLICDEDDTIVLIHDGVRPLINSKVIHDNIESVKQFGSAVTVVPATETIARIDESGNMVTMKDRSSFCIARAPQSFYLNDIIAAHTKALQDGVASTMVDSSMLMTHYGHSLHPVMGPIENIKVTTPMDYFICRALFQEKESSEIWGMDNVLHI